MGNTGNTNNNLSQYLHLYLPVDVELNNGGSKVYNRTAVAVGNTDDEYRYVTLRLGKGLKSFTNSVLLSENRVKPILRPLSDMTEEERTEFEKTKMFVKATPVHHVGNMQWTPETFRWCLSNRFDIFGLIESGKAIDKTKL